MKLKKVLELYRGIAVSEREIGKVIQNIHNVGLDVGQGHWVLMVNDLRNEVDFSKWVRDPELTTEVTRKKDFEIETFAATGDLETSLFYACKHNRMTEKTEGVIVKFTTSLENIFVDGRDFLYTVFSMFDAKDRSEEHRKRVRETLGHLYGPEIFQYFDEATKTPQHKYRRRIALVDLAVNDPQVVIFHASNRIWISGRYGTWFRSSFLVKGKAPPSKIVSVNHVDCVAAVIEKGIPPFETPESYINLYDLI